MIREINKNDIEYINNLTDYKLTNNIFSSCLVYVENNIIAFLDYSIMYEKIEINYIYVKEEYRRLKIASKLLEYLINNNQDKENITLEVDVNNFNAINLYKKFNFKQVAIRKNYYNKTDAYLMEVRLKWKY